MQARGVRTIAAVVLTIVVTLGLVPPAPAPAVPSVQLRFLERWTANTPVGIENAGDGTGRLFIIEQAGRIRLVKDGALAATPFLDISNKVASGGERGLLGLAFPPGFGSKQYFYVNYTDLSGTTVVARYAVSATDPDRADPSSEEILLTISQPFSNHNGGQLAFGPDGYLYIGSGDGGSAGDPLGNGQSTDTLLGKILRIDTESGGAPYDVPASNPFVGVPGARPEIWALGLRNPWRFSFDRSSGALWIADVGQSSREEVNFEPPGFGGGRNYGWNRYEGSLPYPIGSTPTPTTGLTFPVFEYDRTAGRSITGGYVYRGPTQTGLSGLYLFADYVLGKFWALDPADNSTQMVVDTAMLPSSFGQDEAGELYVADHGTGTIFQLLDGSLAPSTTLTRIAGANRYQTAAAIARSAFPNGSTTAVVATGERFPDALAASGLAGALAAPILLTSANSAHPELLAALGPAPGGLGVTDVVIVGGTAAVSPGVVTQLTQRGYSVRRIGEADRYATAAAVANEVRARQGAAFENRAFVVSGEDFPDALAVAPLSYAGRGPVLLTRSASLPPVTAAAVTSLGLTEVVVAGGTQAVSQGVVQSLGAPAVRVQGVDRYATAAAVAEFAFDRAWTDFGYVGIATGADYPDGLTGGVSAGSRDGVLLLTRPTTLSDVTAQTLTAHVVHIDTVEVIGGTSAVSASTFAAIRSRLR